MLNIRKIIRAAEWWEYKLPVLLGAAYATAIAAEKSILELAPWLLLLMFSLVVGAAFVSVVNDITDLKEDEACGKPNRMSRLPAWLRLVLLAFTMLPGAVCWYFFSADPLTTVFYTASWIAFTLYSVPPFRFKKRGLAGVLADASGAHLFPTLFMVSGTAWFLKIEVNLVWIIAAGVWSFMYGLRGILWHQFLDRENDLNSGVTTFATQKDPRRFGKTAVVILVFEMAALALMLAFLSLQLVMLALLLYTVMVWGYSKKFGWKIILIVPTRDRPWHLLMGSFYHCLLPLSLLVTAAFSQPGAWMVLAVHVILFPVLTRNLLLDLKHLARLVLVNKPAL